MVTTKMNKKVRPKRQIKKKRDRKRDSARAGRLTAHQIFIQQEKKTQDEYVPEDGIRHAAGEIFGVYGDQVRCDLCLRAPPHPSHKYLRSSQQKKQSKTPRHGWK